MVFTKFPSAQQVLQYGSSSTIIININGTSNVWSANLNVFSVLIIHEPIEVYSGIGVNAGTEDLEGLWKVPADASQMGRGVTDWNT